MLLIYKNRGGKKKWKKDDILKNINNRNQNFLNNVKGEKMDFTNGILGSYREDKDCENIIISESSSKEELRDFAIYLNSPWNDSCRSWSITQSEISKKESYICKYTVVGERYSEAKIYGYGDTPTIALQNCIENFEELQYEHNPDGTFF